MQSVKIVCIGSATLDLFFQSNDLPETKDGMRLSLAYGGKYIAKKFAESVGGGGCNTAVSLARQGFEVFYWGRVGRDWPGNRVIKKLKKEGVKTSLIQKGEQTTISTILLGKRGERTIVTFRAKNDYLDFNSQVKNAFKGIEFLYFANLPLCPQEERLKWLKFAKKHQIKTCVTLSGGEFKKGKKYVQDFIKLSDIFILNAHELADIWGGDAPDFDLKKINFAEKLKASILIVTHDVHGSFVYTQKRIYYQPIFKTKIVDTTGAGDAYASGFLGEYIKTNDIQQAMKFGAKNASSVISYLTTQKGLLSES